MSASRRPSKDRADQVHLPVMLDEVAEAIEPRSGGLYADLTLGAGGHAKMLLDHSHPEGFLLGLDRDSEILEIARSELSIYEGRFLIRHGNYSRVAEIFENYIGRVDGVVMDLGLSSLQLDQGERGFSIFRDGPLDLRMDTTQPLTGRDLVNKGQPEDLLHAIGCLGEEPRAKPIVKAIVAERKKRPLLHTSDIRSIVEQVYGRKGGKIHPATRTFQGLRMVVNQEQESLKEGIDGAIRLLKAGGRIAVISFHSGEDRICKERFKHSCGLKEGRLIGPKPVKPRSAEVAVNRRSRSARLRVLERI